MDFSQALIEIKLGNKLARTGWNGNDMFVYLCRDNSWIAKGCLWKTRAMLVLKNSDNTIGSWVPSVSDILTDDWYIV